MVFQYVVLKISKVVTDVGEHSPRILVIFEELSPFNIAIGNQ
jgi:hypothetical protein